MTRENDAEYLFITKNDNIESCNEIRTQFWIQDDGSIDFDFWDDCVFNGEEVKILRTFRDKLKYAYACWHNDTEIENIIRKYMPDVTKIRVPNNRAHIGSNLHDWCARYNFTLEEFLTNSKYIVICDANYRAIENIINLGLFDWNNIVQSSLDED